MDSTGSPDSRIGIFAGKPADSTRVHERHIQVGPLHLIFERNLNRAPAMVSVLVPNQDVELDSLPSVRIPQASFESDLLQLALEEPGFCPLQLHVFLIKTPHDCGTNPQGRDHVGIEEFANHLGGVYMKDGCQMNPS